MRLAAAALQLSCLSIATASAEETEVPKRSHPSASATAVISRGRAGLFLSVLKRLGKADRRVLVIPAGFVQSYLVG
jgi:hypothetical protein